MISELNSGKVDGYCQVELREINIMRMVDKKDKSVDCSNGEL